MKAFYEHPLDKLLAERWNSIDSSYKLAFLLVVGVNVLAFGFEMTNLTIHHDDLVHMFVPPELIGHYVGRFSVGWLHKYTQNGYIMPFLQLAQGIILMTAYGMVISHFWGLRKTMEVVLISSVITVFPYVAQVYQYNANMAIYPLGYFLAALALTISTRATSLNIVGAAFIYVVAFSIYQSVLANVIVVLCVWILISMLINEEKRKRNYLRIAKSSAAALTSISLGGLIYLIVIHLMDIQFDSYRSVDKAFSLERDLDILRLVSTIFDGTRSFFLWPTYYFPGYLKMIQVTFLVAACIVCALLPKTILEKVATLFTFAACILAARSLQVVHPEGVYHELTLTSYAVTIAGFVMIVHRGTPLVVRNFASILTIVLIAGYVIQCNWISTVNYLNTLAHISKMTQIITSVMLSLDDSWDGKEVVVVGSYKMSSHYPYKKAVGVASEYIDAQHIQQFAYLLREKVKFVPASDGTPKALSYAASHGPWPSSGAVGMIDGKGVLVLSKE